MATHDYIISNIGKIRAHANLFIEAKLTENGLTGMVASHGAILGVLFKNKGQLPMKEITAKIGKTKSTVTELIRKLEKAGFIEKQADPHDERITNIMLTKKSYAIQDSFKKISAELLKKTYAGFSETEKETLHILLAKLENNLSPH